MGKYVLVAFLVGCIHTAPPPVTPGGDDATADTLAKVASMVDVASRVVGLICDQEGEGTEVCLTLTHSMDMVQFAAADARRLYETYKQTGVGLELVKQAIEGVFTALDALNGNAQLAKVVLNGSTHPVATAYCTRCCGVVVQPPAQAGQAPPDAGAEPAPAGKAP